MTRKKLVKKLLILFSLTVLPVLIIQITVTIMTDRCVRNMAASSQLAAVKHAAGEICLYTRSLMDLLRSSTQTKGFLAFDRDRQRFVLEKLLRDFPMFTELVVSNIKGKETLKLSRFREIATADLQDISDTEKFRTGISGKDYISTVYFSKETKMPAVTFTVPIREEAKVRGVLSAEVDLRDINRVFSNFGIRVGETGYVYVVDNKGVLVSHPNLSLVEQGKNLIHFYPVEKVIKGEPCDGLDAKDRYIDEEGKKMLATGTMLKEFGWAVLAAQPVEEAYFLSQRTKTRTFAYILYGFLTAVVVAVYFSHRVVNPIRKFLKGTEVIGKGNLEHEIDVRTDDELEDLADAFNRMTKSLKESKEKIEEYARTLEEKVEERTKELRETHERLMHAEKMAVIGEMAASIAHELRNSLAGLKVASFYLSRKIAPEKPEIAKNLRAIEVETEQINKAISNILYFSEPVKLAPKPTNLHTIFEEVISISESLTILQNIKVVKNFDPTLGEILVDPERLKQVIMNLTLNSCQAMPQGGEITITTKKINKREVEIKFADTGCGIREENLKKIFSPFFTTHARGLGIGLSVVKSIIEEHKGRIEVESKVGKGTIFIIKLPITQMSADKNPDDRG